MPAPRLASGRPSGRTGARYLFDGVLFAAAAAPVGVLGVQHVQGRLPLFESQGLDLGLELVELLLQVLALLHVLHSAGERTACQRAGKGRDPPCQRPQTQEWLGPATRSLSWGVQVSVRLLMGRGDLGRSLNCSASVSSVK